MKKAKIIVLYVLIIFIQGCTFRKTDKYTVDYIDSTKTNYLIYLKRNTYKCLLISPKSDSLINDVEKIQLGNSYNLKLKKLAINFVLNESVNDNKLLIEGKDISVDRGKVYFSDNLIGLFYIPRTDDILK